MLTKLIKYVVLLYFYSHCLYKIIFMPVRISQKFEQVFFLTVDFPNGGFPTGPSTSIYRFPDHSTDIYTNSDSGIKAIPTSDSLVGI